MFSAVSVCLWVCQHDNFQTNKHKTMKLGGQVHCTEILTEFEFGGHSLHLPKMWRSATTLGKSAPAVWFSTNMTVTAEMTCEYSVNISSQTR